MPVSVAVISGVDEGCKEEEGPVAVVKGVAVRGWGFAVSRGSVEVLVVGRDEEVKFVREEEEEVSKVKVGEGRVVSVEGNSVVDGVSVEEEEETEIVEVNSVSVDGEMLDEEEEVEISDELTELSAVLLVPKLVTVSVKLLLLVGLKLVVLLNRPKVVLF